MAASPQARIFPQMLHHLSRASECVRPGGDAATSLDRVRDHIADVAVKRIQITNRVRMIQVHATRGKGMTRTDLDSALEDVIRDLQQL
jgi:hypothetical protein